ncbi:testis-expressed protein 22 isoform X3 [Monodon monoceros]|uniref:testis-expressed protein 22 isoform X3 n=1 Tax=Monodon monoceros TaxID=40151 RepID=UPI0010F49A72|nr:testis-expressed protein 22 isoform X3 [Monodon monoceros]
MALGVRAAGEQAPEPPLERQHRRALEAGRAGWRREAGPRRGDPLLQGPRADRGPAGVPGRGQGRALPPSTEVRRVQQRLPSLPGPERAFLAQRDSGGPGLEVAALLIDDSALRVRLRCLSCGFWGGGLPGLGRTAPAPSPVPTRQS